MRTRHTLPHPGPCAARRTGILGHMGHTVVHVVVFGDVNSTMAVIDHRLAAR
jgi:hypothetical protein